MWTHVTEPDETAASPSRAAWVLFAARFFAGLCLVFWVCWPSIERMQASWRQLPQYSHGYLIPAFAGIVLWFRRSELRARAPLPSAWGLVWIGLGLTLKIAGTALYYDYIDEVALIPLLWGVCLLAGGWPAWHWLWPAVLLLLFMIPLPFQLETGLQQTLLQIATTASTYLLQTMGYAAFAEGHVIHLPHTQLGVVEACSGMRMSIVCTALAALIAILSSAPVSLRIAVLLSGLPVALIVNLIRICVMGVVAETYGSEFADQRVHDALGYLMMPLALALLGIEYAVLYWVYDVSETEVGEREPMFFHRPATA
jgi:exosortase